MIIINDKQCVQYSSPGHPERPERISKSLELFQSQKEIDISWEVPELADDSDLKLGHSSAHLANLKSATSDFDGDTPAYEGIETHARRSAGAALQAMNHARKGKTVFSLMRPPGHHATKNRAMGFCYLNSVAISTLLALKEGEERVAVFDFDVHHGNGTEAILVNHPNVAFYSIHQHPCYPGTGAMNVGDNCFNYPVAPYTPATSHREVIQKALDDMKDFEPSLIAVSAGFDAYKHDPIANEMLEPSDFKWIGQQLQGLGIPFYSLLEGGYSDALPELIMAYLKGVVGV